MNELPWFGVVLALYAAPILIFVGTSLLARRYYHRQDRRNPISKNFLRPPGHTLNEKLDDIRTDMLAHLGGLAPAPLMFLAMYQGGQRTTTSLLIFSAATAFALSFGAYRMATLVKKARNVRLGWEAEMSAGQELSQLMRDAFFVYHDVPGGGDYNVDHVVAGPQGVFAIETKGRAKPVLPNGEGHKLRYDGKQLHFPGWVETAPLDQARRNAKWLKEWLSSAVGAPVEATPVLMLPGWYIERTSPAGVAVLNGTNCRSYFVKPRESTLSEQLLRQIAHQLDARCRDVEPRVHKPVKD